MKSIANTFRLKNPAEFSAKYEDALRVAQNALDVAEKANVNSLFFTSLFKMKLAEIYAIRGDSEMANINAQEALQIAEINGYNYIKANLSNAYYDFSLKQIAANPSVKEENIKKLYKQLLVSNDAVKILKNEETMMQIKQKIEAIEDFAQKNSITLD